MFLMYNKLKQQVSAQAQQLQQQQAIIDAISRSMAVIEFTPQGHVLTANQNFLTVMGYSLTEIQGQHHRLFVDPQQAESAAYQSFWVGLAQGKVASNRFKRVAKDGRNIWIEASYNPIFDAQGKVIKVVKFATDITQKVIEELNARGQLSAINRAMAVIEFDLQGHILTANNNFLATMGYTLTEIVGKHHRLFVDTACANSAEYQQFWAGLREGEFYSGTYQRFDKNGKEVWIEASYNPIFDPDGKACKVVKYAVDVGANPNTKLLRSVVEDVAQVLNEVAVGHLSTKLKGDYEKQRKSMFYPLITQLQAGINHMLSALKQSVGSVMMVANGVNDVSHIVSENAANLNEKMQLQAASLEEATATMQEITSTVQSNTEISRQVAELARHMQGQASEGAGVMKNTIDAMRAISESSHKIADIVNLIDGIAFQTNLLALNAAVEAARAGEHGRGFAVVAGEVRALSQKSAEAAKDIRVLIGDSVARISSGTALVDQLGDMLTGIHQSITGVTAKVEQIAQASTEQAAALHQVNHAIAHIDRVNQENTMLVESAGEAATTLLDNAQTLHDNMAHFKV